MKYFALLTPFAFALTACGTSPSIHTPPVTPDNAPVATTSGKYYLNDGPLKGITKEMIEAIPEPTPRLEPLNKWAMKPYNVLGATYTPMTSLSPHKERGVGSWYGTRYHGKKGSIGEPYDMLKLTAAHPTLPLPSYARVTNLENGKSIIVRVNDRGPFLHNRIIDLSYAAAMRLGYAEKGSASVEVELLLP